MLKFELRTTTPPPPPPSAAVSIRDGGIKVDWPIGMPWEEYLKKLKPIGTLCRPGLDDGWFQCLKNGRSNTAVTIVAGYCTEPTGGIIIAGCRRVQPYILANIYIPGKTAMYEPKAWVRMCDGEYAKPLTPEETEEVLKNDTFLSLFEEWRQQTNFEELGRDCLGAGQRQVPSEGRTEGENQRHVTI